jgi:hypothetical protein
MRDTVTLSQPVAEFHAISLASGILVQPAAS